MIPDTGYSGGRIGPIFVTDVRHRKVRYLATKAVRHALVEEEAAHAADARATSISLARVISSLRAFSTCWPSHASYW